MGYGALGGTVACGPRLPRGRFVRRLRPLRDHLGGPHGGPGLRLPRHLQAQRQVRGPAAGRRVRADGRRDGTVRYLPPGGQLPGHGNPFGGPAPGGYGQPPARAAPAAAAAAVRRAAAGPAVRTAAGPAGPPALRTPAALLPALPAAAAPRSPTASRSSSRGRRAAAGPAALPAAGPPAAEPALGSPGPRRADRDLSPRTGAKESNVPFRSSTAPPARNASCLASAQSPSCEHRGGAMKARGGRWIEHWEPEDESFWKRDAARRSPAAQPVVLGPRPSTSGSPIWTLWSVMVLFMGPDVRHRRRRVSSSWSRCPRWSARCVRLPYTFAVAKFGGRNWTIVQRGMLLVPTSLAAFVMQPGTSLLHVRAGRPLIEVSAAATSPRRWPTSTPSSRERQKGWALGLNAGGGNIGVPAHPAGRPADHRHGRRGRRRGCVLGIYIPLIVVAAVLCRALHGQPRHGEGTTPGAMPGGRPGRPHLGDVASSTSAPSARSSATASPSAWCCRTSSAARRCRPRAVTFIGPLLGSLDPAARAAGWPTGSAARKVTVCGPSWRWPLATGRC